MREEMAEIPMSRRGRFAKDVEEFEQVWVSRWDIYCGPDWKAWVPCHARVSPGVTTRGENVCLTRVEEGFIANISKVGNQPWYENNIIGDEAEYIPVVEFVDWGDEVEQEFNIMDVAKELLERVQRIESALGKEEVK